MRKAYIIVYQNDPYNSLFDVLFGDLHKNPDVFFVTEKDYPQQGLYSFLPSRKLKRLTMGLSDRCYLHYYNLPKLIQKLSHDYDHISVLMHNACLKKPEYPIEVFDLLKGKASFNLLYLDTHDHLWVCRHANYLFENGVFDKVFSIDPKDAKRYHINLYTTPYSKIETEICPVPEYQLFFCGSKADRMFSLYRIWKEIRKRGVTAEFDLIGAKEFEDFFEKDDRVHFVDHLPYMDVINKTLKAECILDIVQKDQSALSIRPYEAVVYNKKLLTNNKSILDFKYYDSRYMQYFENVDTIDWEWVKEDLEVDYGYKGDFSPSRLLDQLA